MKKIILFVITIIILFSTMGCKKMFKLTEKNSKNYEVLSEKSVPEQNFNIVEISHKNTKAKILLFICDDENRVFNIAFRTPINNSKGMPHILEHSVLCGSRKYDLKDPFIKLAKGSLNTFLNALTFPDKTCYPIASANIKDFHNLMDVYLDAVFYPNAIRDKKIFEQEGWHYEIADKDEDLKVNGVVYSEMKGVFSDPNSLLEYDVLHTLCKGSTYEYQSGGDPEEIINLSYDEFVDFHDKFYSASNAIIMYYGALDYNEELSYLDSEYLSKQEYVECDSEITSADSWIPSDEKISYYNIDSDDIKDKSYIAYSFSIDSKKETKKNIAMQVLNYILFASEGAIIRNKCLSAGLGESVVASYDTSIKDCIYSIIAQNIDESKKDIFLKTIDDSLKEIIDKGLDKDMVKAALNVLYFSAAEDEYGTDPKGLYMTLNALETYLYGDDYDTFLLYKDAFSSLEKEDLDSKDNYFIKLLKEVFVDNNHKCVNVLVPKKGYLAEKEEKLKKELLTRKKTMSDDDIIDIINGVFKLKTYQQAEEPKEKLDLIPMLKVNDIERDKNVIDYKLGEIEGVHTIYSYDNDKDIIYMNLAFDISDFSDEEIFLISSMVYLLSKIDIKDMTYQELNNYIDQNTGFFAPTVNVFLDKAFMTYKVKVTEKNLDYAFDIYDKLISGTEFKDKNKISILLNEQKTNALLTMLSSGHQSANHRALSDCFWSSKIIDMISPTGIGFNLYIDKITAAYNKNPDVINDIYTSLYKKVISSSVSLQYCINEKYANEFVKKAKKFIQKQNIIDKTYDSKNYNDNIKKLDESVKFSTLLKDVRREAIVTPNDINFCACAGNFDKDKYNGIFRLLKTIFNYEYLWTNLRVLGGAYGCSFTCNRAGNYSFVSYRDPNLTKTNNTYKGVSDYLRNFSKSDDDLVKYIIGTMGGFDNPISINGRFDRNISAYYSHIDNEIYNKERHDVLDAKAKDVRDIAVVFENVKDGSYCALISEKCENEAKESYDKVWKIGK